jgi:hypothetical protein
LRGHAKHGDAWQRRHLSGITPIRPPCPETLSGSLIIRHLCAVLPKKGVGGSRQVIIRTASEVASAGYWARLAPTSYVGSIIPALLAEGRGGSYRRNGPVGAGWSWHQQLYWAIPPWDQGVQHRPHHRRATHPAGYGRVKMWHCCLWPERAHCDRPWRLVPRIDDQSRHCLYPVGWSRSPSR